MNDDSARVYARRERDRLNRLALAAGLPCRHPNPNPPAARLARIDGTETLSYCPDCKGWAREALDVDAPPQPVPLISLDDFEVEDAA